MSRPFAKLLRYHVLVAPPHRLPSQWMLGRYPMQALQDSCKRRIKFHTYNMVIRLRMPTTLIATDGT